MATPLGHSIVGFTLARLAGVRSAPAVALSVGAASLPDIDFVLGYVTSGDARSLHHELITHKPVFPLLVGAATGLAVLAQGVARRRLPGPRTLLGRAGFAAALVASHVAMDRLPLPYDDMPVRSASPWEAAAAHAWNVVVDLAVYGTLAVMVLGRRNGEERPAEA
jgi:hypothetical protein